MFGIEDERGLEAPDDLRSGHGAEVHVEEVLRVTEGRVGLDGDESAPAATTTGSFARGVIPGISSAASTRTASAVAGTS